MITIKEAVKNSTAKFEKAIAGVLYYNLTIESVDVYQFTVDMNDRNDVSTATFESEYRGITLMKYINKAMKSETFIKIK